MLPPAVALPVLQEKAALDDCAALQASEHAARNALQSAGCAAASSPQMTVSRQKKRTKRCPALRRELPFGIISFVYTEGLTHLLVWVTALNNQEEVRQVKYESVHMYIEVLQRPLKCSPVLLLPGWLHAKVHRSCHQMLF